MRKVSARKTTLVQIDSELAATFVAEYHRQGMARPGSNLRSFGLYLDDELLAVALFCNPRTRGMQKLYTAELFRMAFKADVRVQGGASKLIRHFMGTGAFDLFTYQDLSGEVTDVYSHSGLEYISERAEKEVLVIDGKSLSEAEDNRRDWFSLEQAVRFGPDMLIGTTLGEVATDRGRKSNIELFLESGYHLETVPGDRIYGWRNPSVRFYTYRIGSTESSSYYIGRRAYRNPGLTEAELLQDGYFGSGGKKLKDWLETVTPESLTKEILGIHSDWPAAIRAEREAIGDSYRDDPNCLNMQPGGMGLGASVANLRELECSVHGLSIHNGKSCMKCSGAKRFSLGNCQIHGESTFLPAGCVKCIQAERYAESTCPSHGLTTHRDGNCVSCTNSRSISLRSCPEHGFTKHIGEVCSTCNSRSGVSLRTCPIHGETKFRGSTCSSCSAEAAVSLRICAVHGENKHSGEHCMRCNAEGQLTTGICEIHGSATFKGGSCTRCTVAKALSEKLCPKHGLTTHQGDVCGRCNAAKVLVQRECPKHGLTTHQGTVCNRCNAEKSISQRECSVHGSSKFQGDQCVKCRNDAQFSEQECSVHGLTKHRGKSCMRCAQANRKKPDDRLREQGLTRADVREAARRGDTLVTLESRFGISKYHLKKIIGEEAP